MQSGNGNTTHHGTNALRFEKSPYLLQHAANPVEWLPWGDEAFAQAREKHIPVFVSIGYSTCHWCHVMERESFEDAEVADYLNRHFISIKVDKEERPDIDEPLMAVCQALSGRGGHPLTAFLTPDGKPFFAGTYFPKHSSPGRMGFLDLLERIRQIWKSERERVVSSADEIIRQLSRPGNLKQDVEFNSIENLKNAAAQFSQRYDSVYGGFNQHPKFPVPHSLTFLLRYAARFNDGDMRRMAETTLQAMRFGGIFDHVGFGFHRYSTDRLWLLPHFEKMLYDQALVLLAYSEAYSVTGQHLYKQVASEIVEYLHRDLMSDDGLFFTAEDADSEGEEGKFYVWTHAEVSELLLPEDVEFLERNFALKHDGNFADESTGEYSGANILHILAWHSVLATKEGVHSDEWTARWERIRILLLTARSKRIRPMRDEKILCDWNALMIAALARSSRFCGVDAWGDAAIKGLFGLEQTMMRDGRLYHRYCDGELRFEAYLDDYVSFLWATVECMQLTGNTELLERAHTLCEHIYGNITDGNQRNIPRRFAENPSLPQTNDAYDGAIPSAYSLLAYCCEHLYLIDGDNEMRRRADAIYAAFADDMQRYPSGYSMMLNSMMFASEDVEIIHIECESSNEYQHLRRMIDAAYHPLRVVVRALSSKPQPTIRICNAKECHTTLHSKEELTEYLKGAYVR